MRNAPLSRALRKIKQLLCGQSLIFYYIKQIDSMLPCICPVIDHRGHQNVVRTSVTHSAIASCATFLFSPHFDVICDLLLDRCTATWNLFVKFYFLIQFFFQFSSSKLHYKRQTFNFFIQFFFSNSLHQNYKIIVQVHQLSIYTLA